MNETGNKLGIKLHIMKQNIIELPRQEVDFLEECRKIKGFGSLREDFYEKVSKVQC